MVLECAPELQQRRPEADCCAVCPPAAAAAETSSSIAADGATVNNTLLLSNNNGSWAGAGGAAGVAPAARRSACEWRGQAYAANATWTVGACKSCRCVAGEVRCVWQSCPKLRCKAQESAVKEPGQCCPQCEEGELIKDYIKCTNVE